MSDHQAGLGPARRLSERLAAVGPGWHPLLLQLHAQLCALDADYKVEDLKEKLGTLRVRITVPESQRPEARDLVRSAEEQSEGAIMIVNGAVHRRGQRRTS
jgi:hypothetical protein